MQPREEARAERRHRSRRGAGGALDPRNRLAEEMEPGAPTLWRAAVSSAPRRRRARPALPTQSAARRVWPSAAVTTATANEMAPQTTQFIAQRDRFQPKNHAFMDGLASVVGILRQDHCRAEIADRSEIYVLQFIVGPHPLALSEATRPYLSRSRILVPEECVSNADFDRPDRAFVIRVYSLIDCDVEIVSPLGVRVCVLRRFRPSVQDQSLSPSPTNSPRSWRQPWDSRTEASDSRDTAPVSGHAPPNAVSAT